MIVLMMNLIRTYFDVLLNMVEMQGYFFFIFYTVLLYDNFRFTEMLYHFMIEEGFNRSSTYIEKAIEVVKSYISENQLGILNYIKLNISSLFVLLMDNTPAAVKPYTELIFFRVRKYQQQISSE